MRLYFALFYQRNIEYILDANLIQRRHDVLNLPSLLGSFFCESGSSPPLAITFKSAEMPMWCFRFFIDKSGIVEEVMSRRKLYLLTYSYVVIFSGLLLGLIFVTAKDSGCFVCRTDYYFCC